MWKPFFAVILCFSWGHLTIGQEAVPSCLLLDDLSVPQSVDLSLDGRRLAIGGGTPKGGDWKLVDLEKAEWMVHGKQRCACPWAVRISPKGTYIATGGNWSCLYIADTKNGETYWDLTNKGHIGVIHNLCFTPDEKYLVSMDPGDVTIRVWDIKARKPHASFRFCGERGSNLWSNVDYVETAKHVFHIDVAPDFSKVAAEYGGIEGSTLTPDGKLLVVAGNTKGKIPFLDLRTGKAEKTIQLKRGRASRLHFTPDGKWLVAGVYYKTDKNESRGAIEIWDMEKQKQITSLGEHESRVTRIAISPDKKTIVSGGSMDGFRVWDVITGKQKFSYFTKDDPRLPRVKVSPDTPDKPFIQHSTMAAGCAFLANGETFIIVPSWSLWNTEVYFHETATGRPVDFRKAVKELKTPKN